MRIKRLDIREFATALGREVMEEMRNWPQNGDGRAIKACSEQLIKATDVSSVGGFSQAIKDFGKCRDIMSDLVANGYFVENVGKKSFIDRHRAGHILIDYASRLEIDLADFLDENTISLVDAANISKETVNEIAKVLPEQKFGAVYFHFSGVHLELERRRDYVKGDSRKIVEEARARLVRDGKELLSHLAASNCDARLITSVAGIVEDIEEANSIVQTGISLITLEEYVRLAGDEVQPIVLSILRGFVYGATHFVGQFREWELFVENSSESNFDQNDIESARRVGRALADGLGQKEISVSPEVPKSFRLLADAIIDYRSASRRAAWAMLRAVENLIIVVAKECVTSVSALKKGVDKGLGKGGAAVALATLLYVAISAAGDITPQAARVMKSTWIDDIVKIINAK